MNRPIAALSIGLALLLVGDGVFEVAADPLPTKSTQPGRGRGPQKLLTGTTLVGKVTSFTSSQSIRFPFGGSYPGCWFELDAYPGTTLPIGYVDGAGMAAVVAANAMCQMVMGAFKNGNDISVQLDSGEVTSVGM
jgi:hypothetical protein